MKTQEMETADHIGESHGPLVLENILLCHGAWSRQSTAATSAWALYAKKGLILHEVDYPGHKMSYDVQVESLDGKSFDDFVSAAESRLFKMIRSGGQEPVDIAGHSLGALVAAKVAEKNPNLIASYTAIASAPMKGINCFHGRMLKFRYLRAMITGRAYTLHPSDAKFVADGSDVELGPESGKLLSEVVQGIEVARLADFAKYFSSQIIIPVNDRVVPREKAEKIAKYHGIVPKFVPGGHFSFIDKEHREEVVRLLRSFVSTSS